MKKLIIVAAMIMAPIIHAEPEPILYGTVTDNDGQTFTGSIMWDNQETFLSDIFNAQKNKTVGIEYLNKQQLSELEDHQPGPQINIGNVQITFKSLFGKDIDPSDFSVHFGAIKYMDIDDGVFIATLHDGTTITSNDNANDLTGAVQLKNRQGEQQSYELDDLKHIEFSQAPVDAKTWGDGIYGTITTDSGKLQGRVMWDKDERLTDEELDGNDATQDYEIKFADIFSIEKDNNSSTVVLRDGKTLSLTGTNDVNQSNRGIWLDHPKFGRMEINWHQFQKLVIEPVTVDWLNFDDYAAMIQPLTGTITLRSGEKVKADQIAYDLNQQSPLELFEVKINGATHQLPFRLVKKLTIKNEQSVDLLLRDGIALVAYGSHSVNRDNNGLLVTAANQQQWLQWKDILVIEFD